MTDPIQQTGACQFDRTLSKKVFSCPRDYPYPDVFFFLNVFLFLIQCFTLFSQFRTLFLINVLPFLYSLTTASTVLGLAILRWAVTRL